MTDDTLVLTALRPSRAPSEAERRRRLIRDVFSWAMVAGIHVVFFLVLVISLQENRDRLGHRSAIETMLDLSLLNRTNAPRVDIVNPQKADSPDVSSAPLTIPPPKIPVPEIPPSSNSASDGDVLKSVGEAIACGASNFEYLNKAQQARCRRQPWLGARLPNGVIVLDAPQRLVVPQAHISGADEARHEMMTNSGCPIMSNAPCLEDMFTGANSANPGTPAH